jgi:XTP/dITP diphosphohydrolase
MIELIMATNNAHKLEEVRQILGNKFLVKGLADIGCHEDIPETAETLEGNALQKVRYVHERYKVNCFADDTGLEVDALDGAPGVHSARYATDGHDFEANTRLLLHNMEGKEDRRARFRTAIILIEGGEEHLFEGRVEGEITCEPAGCGGFGYDPVFRPEGYEQTFAEMSADEKNAISHRARAVAKLVEYLKR